MSIKTTTIGLCIIISLLVLPTKVIAEPADIKEQTIDELISFYSDYYNVSEDVLHSVISCESRYNPMAHNSIGENSWGLVQINLNAHKSITVEQATDPNYAIDFLAKNISKGNGRIWTCFRKL